MTVSDKIDALALTVATVSLVTTLLLGWFNFRYTKKTYALTFKPTVRPRPRVETTTEMLSPPRSSLVIDVKNDGKAPIEDFELQATVAAPRHWWSLVGARDSARLADLSAGRIESEAAVVFVAPGPPQSLERVLANGLRSAIVRHELDPSEYGASEWMRREWYQAKVDALVLTLALSYRQAEVSCRGRYEFRLRPIRGGESVLGLQGWTVE